MTTRLAAAFVVLAGSVAPGSGPGDRRPEVRVTRDLVYGTGGREELRLDLTAPAAGRGPFPAVVCVHGGGWYQGHRRDMDAAAERLARRGYVAASVGYRLAPAARFPAQIEDCKAAVRWLRANAARYAIDPDRIGALGPSAGGHLACLLGVTDGADGLDGGGGNPRQSGRVRAVVAFFARTDFTKKTWTPELEAKIFVPLLGAAFDDRPDLYRRASPVAYVKPSAPPFLLFHGADDALVPARNSTDLAARLRAAGGAAKAVVVAGEGHGGGDWVEKWAKHLDAAEAFFDAHLKN